ncbi:hypothetical protein [Mycobacterium kansasii]|uniref:hypothetical protein n=1 Tax=Mycobacterium kansasii TaxID=1768 RepID=UPI001156D7D3|nr:hypothetical protein [Mycobacterium kansasii]
MRDLDDDDRDPYPPPWYSGPPRRPSRSPVIEAYVDTCALDVGCPNCHAEVGDFCRHHPDLGGAERKVPCLKRILTAAHIHSSVTQPEGIK